MDFVCVCILEMVKKKKNVAVFNDKSRQAVFNK